MVRKHSETSVGAFYTPGGVRFRVWAPTKHRVDLCVDHQGRMRSVEMEPRGDGFFEQYLEARAGDLYCYLVDGDGPFPDPASRFQPYGVHGPSEVINANAYVWSDDAWRGPDLLRTVIYELHIGTFTEEGTFTAAIGRLPYLQDLGVKAIELMPVGDFPGERNWGYDVAALFAPARCYGRPDDLRAFVDAAHHHGLAVLLDVVYNHLGPDGVYHQAFTPFYFSPHHRTAWGASINVDGRESRPVRDLLVENAIYWLRDFHFDGLRLDATHALYDSGPRHILAELSTRVRAALQPRTVLLIAEDERNKACLVVPEAHGGFGLDAVWADDFHHQIRRHVAGDHEGYFAEFSGTIADIATTIERGWFYTGQAQPMSGRCRGTDPAGLAAEQFVLCLQNHDQIGNRAFGDRLHGQIDPAVYRAITVLLLSLPQTPLLFMGQEWAATTPFLFFTDHRSPLGARVSAGRRNELKAFRGFTDPKVCNKIPDPQRVETFEKSCLEWSELEQDEHARVHRLYRACLRLRGANLFPSSEGTHHACRAVGNDTLALIRWNPVSALMLLVNFDGATEPIDTQVLVREHVGAAMEWSVLLHSEQDDFVTEARPPTIDLSAGAPRLTWHRAGAIVCAGALAVAAKRA